MEVILILMTLMAIGTLIYFTPLHKQLSQRPAMGLIIFTLINALVLLKWRGIWQLWPMNLLLLILMLEYLALTLLKNKKFRVTVKFNRKLFLVGAYMTFGTILIFPVFSKMGSLTHHENIGTWKMVIESADRVETLATVEGIKRRYSLSLYYPIQTDSGSTKPWLEGGNPSIEGLSKSYGLPEALMGHLKKVRTDAKNSRKIRTPDTPYPVIVISHGVKGSSDQFSRLAQSLADQGYFVAVLNHPYTAYTAVFEDNDYILGAQSPAAQLDYVDQKIELERQITLIQQADLMESFKVLDQLNQGAYEARFKGLLDLSDMTLVGHQIGGGAVVTALNQVTYVKTAILFNPILEQIPKKYILSGTSKPLISLVTEDYLNSNNATYFKRFTEGSPESLVYQAKSGKDLDMMDLGRISYLFTGKGLSSGPYAQQKILKAQVELIQQGVQKYSQGQIFEDIAQNLNLAELNLLKLEPDEIDGE